MRTIEELRAFCDGYAHGLITMLTTLQSVDDWVVWGGYDITLQGRTTPATPRQTLTCEWTPTNQAGLTASATPSTASPFNQPQGETSQ